MKLKQITHVFLLGIGGIGMSALARYFQFKGLWVGGYDRTSTPLSRLMEEEGMHIFYEDEPKNLPPELLEPSSSNLIIYTPSIPQHNKVKNFFLDKGFELYKRSVVLGRITEDKRVVAVAGTHGKTTTSTMISHILKVGGIDCISFLGGISTNYKTNFLPGLSDIAVVEADEYDRSFLTLYPQMSIITSMDADHLDIYGNLENLHAAFNEFSEHLKKDGYLLTKKGLPIHARHKEYEIEKEEEILSPHCISARNIRIQDGVFFFDYWDRRVKIKGLQIQTPGYYNIENAVAAISVALKLGISISKIKRGIETFMGVKRRFEYVLKGEDQIYIDDYAHHQDELNAFLNTVRLLYPDKHITAIFQPHLFTRTRDFYHEMAQSLSRVDRLYLMDIYPAREEPIPGITSEILLQEVRLKEKYILKPEEILDRLKTEPTQVVLTIGAGDIDKLTGPIKEILEKKPDAIKPSPWNHKEKKGGKNP
jgi:UDP-N-acetylmuramate--alanine ligase